MLKKLKLILIVHLFSLKKYSRNIKIFLTKMYYKKRSGNNSYMKNYTRRSFMRSYSKYFYTLIFLLLFTSLTPSAMENSPVNMNDSSTLYKENNEVVQVFNYQNQKLYLTREDINLMSKIVYAESN